MFACINLEPAGFFVSKPRLIGFTDDEIAAVNNTHAAPERANQVREALLAAMAGLYHIETGGRAC